MRLIASLLYCLLALAGCHERSGTTTIVRATNDGVDAFFSKTVAGRGTASFHCLASRSGRCHYLVYDARCADAARACPRRELDRFDLAVGQVRELKGLDEGFRQCASADAIGEDC